MTGVLDLDDKIICLDFFGKGDLYYEILSTIYPVLNFPSGSSLALTTGVFTHFCVIYKK